MLLKVLLLPVILTSSLAYDISIPENPTTVTVTHAATTATPKPDVTTEPTTLATVLPTTSHSTPDVTTKKNAVTTASPAQNRRFDGPSFVGGIVLAAGLTGIGFVSWKFYKATTERNYHTL